MSRHTIVAQPTVRFRVPGLEDLESADPTIEIVFDYTPGYSATGPSYDSGGEPGSGAEVELVSAKLLDGDGLDPDQKTVSEWASDWLNDAGYDLACEAAEEDRRPDPDEQRERMRDEGR